MIFTPEPIIAEPTLARPWKSASAAKRSVFSTYQQPRDFDEPTEISLMPTTDG